MASASPTIVPVPCLQDNYAYLVFDPDGDGRCLIVDACHPEPIAAELERRGLEAAAVLTTHHHWDHVGGNRYFSERGVDIYAHESERNRIVGMTRGLRHGQGFAVLGFEVSARHVPGHTQGAVTYCFDGFCFTGDTLFCGGCGRLLEGSAEQMYRSLNQELAKLPDQMVLYSGHEYTQKNLEFALSVWPHETLQRRYREVERLRARGRYCASATFATERATNPFLMCQDLEMQGAVGEETPFDAFVELRRRKDRF